MCIKFLFRSIAFMLLMTFLTTTPVFAFERIVVTAQGKDTATAELNARTAAVRQILNGIITKDFLLSNGDVVRKEFILKATEYTTAIKINKSVTGVNNILNIEAEVEVDQEKIRQMILTLDHNALKKEAPEVAVAKKSETPSTVAKVEKEYSNKAFDGIYKKIEDYLDLAERNKSPQQERWYTQPFSDTKGSLEKKLNALLDSALEALLDGRLLTLKYDINTLKQKNNKLNNEIADSEIKKLSAPKNKEVYEVWKSDINDIEKKISDLKQEIASNLEKIENNKNQILLLLQDEGLDVSQDTINSLIETVDGDDTVKSMVVLQNVQMILDKLQGVLKNTGENIDIAKKYYGIYLLSTHTYYYILNLQKNKILTQYIPKLNKIRDDNRILMTQTKSLANTDSYVLNNLAAQKLTDEASKKYEIYLLKQVKNIDIRIEKVDIMLKRAFNTYETVSLAHSLSGMIANSINEYGALTSLPLLDPMPFENKEMQSKISEITSKLE